MRFTSRSHTARCLLLSFLWRAHRFGGIQAWFLDSAFRHLQIVGEVVEPKVRCQPVEREAEWKWHTSPRECACHVFFGLGAIQRPSKVRETTGEGVYFFTKIETDRNQPVCGLSIL